MVTPSLTLVCCLLAQDAGAPPATIAAPPPQSAAPQMSSRRSRPKAPATGPSTAVQAPPFRPQPATSQPVAGQAVEVQPVATLPGEIPPDELQQVESPSVELDPAEQAVAPEVAEAEMSRPRAAVGSAPSARIPASRPAAAAAAPAGDAVLQSDPQSAPRTRIEPAAENHPAGSPGAVLADALSINATLEATGKPMRLVEVLGHVRDPRIRLSAIDAYWGVSLAWVAAHWQWSDHDCVARMEAMSPAAADPTQQAAREAKFRARMTATLADWKQTEVELAEAQQRLASLMRLAPSEPLPIAADMPHVGAYKTRFETLYASQPAPERSLLIHRTLPLRERELRTRAEAVEAARQALEAAEAGFHEGTVALETVFSCLDDQKRERQAFLTVVHRYNVDIAEYALATPVPAADDQILVARLIKLRRDDGTRLEPRDSSHPSAAIGGTASPIAVAPSRTGTFEQPAMHVQAVEPAVDPTPPDFEEDAPPIQRGEE